MPYKVGGSNLPSNVKKMGDKQQAQWVAVWNSEYEKHNDEGRAFAAANGVVGKKKDYYDQLYDAASKKVSQSAVGYDALGMKDGMACATCHWFLSPDGCAIVSGDISPTGLSRFYMQPQAQDAMPVTMVEVDDSGDDDCVMPMMGKSTERNIVEAVVNGVKSVLGFTNTTKDVVEGNTPLTFFAVKDTHGDTRLRFMAVVSNNFRDRENEVIPESAHQEFVSWAAKENAYPELWLWHAGPATRWGQADWLDVSDGFLIASGLVDKGFEYIAHNIESDVKAGNPVGVSHGFLCVKSGGTISPYRSFELSPLPLTAAANEWTAFTTLNGDSMAFTPQRREWLKKNGGISDEAISTLEQATSSVAKALKERGIEYKNFGVDVSEDGTVTATIEKPVSTKPLSPLDAAIASITGLKSASANANTNKEQNETKTEQNKPKTEEKQAEPVVPPHSPVQQPQPGAGATQTPNPQVVDKPTSELSSKEFTDLTAKIDATNTAVVEIGTTVKGLVEQFQAAITRLSMSEDEKTAAFFRSKVDALPRGFQASADASNTNDPLAEKVTKQIADVQKNGWWSDLVIKDLTEVQQ